MRPLAWSIVPLFSANQSISKSTPKFCIARPQTVHVKTGPAPEVSNLLPDVTIGRGRPGPSETTLASRACSRKWADHAPPSRMLLESVYLTNSCGGLLAVSWFRGVAQCDTSCDGLTASCACVLLHDTILGCRFPFLSPATTTLSSPTPVRRWLPYWSG